MTEEPYRWLEAIANRREYVRDQLKGGSPVFGVSLPEGMLLLGVGTGQSKVYEIFDRQALAGLGHPADVEKIRQAAIDAAHMEAFTRAPEDVSLRRLVGFGLGPQLKTNFEQIFSAPFLVELLLAEISGPIETDLWLRLHFDGAFQIQNHGIAVVASEAETETAAQSWLTNILKGKTNKTEVVELLLQGWWIMTSGKSFTEDTPGENERRDGWRKAVNGRVVEIGLLARNSPQAARYQPLSLTDLGL